MQKSRISKDKCYVMMARALSWRSTCLDKQVGCIIINDKNEIISSGYNGASRGELHCTDLGYCIKEAFHNKDKCPAAHAEQNALLQCKVPEQIHTIYLTLSPCVSCVRVLMNTPCKRIVFMDEHRHPAAEMMWVHGGKEWCRYGNE